MEARIELLEKGFEVMFSMRETIEKHREDDRAERTEIRPQVTELVASMRHTEHHSLEGKHHHETLSDDGDASVNHNFPRCREERWRKLEITVLEGNDAYEWLNCVHKYFDLKRKNETGRLQAVMVAMEGKL